MNIDSILDIENILYSGTIDEIKRVLNDYQVSYSYSEKCQSFEIESKKLLEKSRGHGAKEKPNCVVLLGEQYKFNK